MKPALIGVDWGTTSLRAYLIAADGAILARQQSQRGILSIAPGARSVAAPDDCPGGNRPPSADQAPGACKFELVLQEVVGPWRSQHPGLPIVMSGMIGSRQGWVEAPYVRCPAGVGDIANHLMRIPAKGLDRVWLVPGLDTRDEAGRPDVMRGEEVQVFGCAHVSGGRLAEGVSPDTKTSPGANKIVLPGTHSKWVTVEGGRITGFRTFMTGEVFAALKDHTILGRLMQGHEPNAPGFARGVRAAAQGGGPGWLLGALFSVRSLGLFDQLPAYAAADYLSGLLIGSEITEAARGGEGFCVLSGEPLLSRYMDAARLLDLRAEPVAADTIVHGYLALARAASLIEARA